MIATRRAARQVPGGLFRTFAGPRCLPAPAREEAEQREHEDHDEDDPEDAHAISCLLVVSIVDLHRVIPPGINEKTSRLVTRPERSPRVTAGLGALPRLHHTDLPIAPASPSEDRLDRPVQRRGNRGGGRNRQDPGDHDVPGHAPPHG